MLLEDDLIRPRLIVDFGSDVGTRVGPVIFGSLY